MKTIENEVNTGATITLDDKHFINCRFTNCKLIYSGGDWSMTETKVENCQVTLAGAAQKTANFLAFLNAMNPGGGTPPQLATQLH